MAHIIGLTGGIGSGKSTVARVLNALGHPVFSADQAGHRAYAHPDVKTGVVQLFGHEAYMADGNVNRKMLAERVFNNPALLQQLNALIHPNVKQQFEAWVKAQGKQVLVFREAAILFESGSHADCEAVVTVSAPEYVRIQRVMARDGSDETQVRARMAKQFSDEKRRQLAEYEIVNDGLQPVVPQVTALVKTLISRFGDR